MQMISAIRARAAGFSNRGLHKLSVDLRHMRHFVAVAEELHFGRAAKRLNIAQPPLSQSIRRLEVDLGVVLFTRSRREVALTPAGHVFLREARSTLQQADIATKLVRRAAEHRAEVRVGFIGPALYRFLPSALAEFTRKFPEILVKLHDHPSPVQVEKLLAGDLDVAFASGTSRRCEDCQVLTVERAPLVAAIPSDWPLAAQTSVQLADLADKPFILPPPFKFDETSAEILSMFFKAGFVPTVTQESTHAHTTVSLVGAGLGYSLITATAVLTAQRGVTFRPIVEFGPSHQWSLTMIWDASHQTDASRCFTDFISAYVADHPENLEFESGLWP